MANIEEKKPRKGVCFNVDVELTARAMNVIGNKYGGQFSKHGLIELLDAYEAHQSCADAQAKLETIASMYECKVADVVDTCSRYKDHYMVLREAVLSLEDERKLLVNRVNELENERKQLVNQLNEAVNQVNQDVNQGIPNVNQDVNQVNQTVNEGIPMVNHVNQEVNQGIPTVNGDSWMYIKSVIPPFTSGLLESTAERLSARYHKEVRPVQILLDMFMRYTIERWSEWFYPFVLSDAEILRIAQQVNPEIKTVNQLKQLLKK